MKKIFLLLLAGVIPVLPFTNPFKSITLPKEELAQKDMIAYIKQIREFVTAIKITHEQKTKLFSMLNTLQKAERAVHAGKYMLNFGPRVCPDFVKRIQDIDDAYASLLISQSFFEENRSFFGTRSALREAFLFANNFLKTDLLQLKKTIPAHCNFTLPPAARGSDISHFTPAYFKQVSDFAEILPLGAHKGKIHEAISKLKIMANVLTGAIKTFTGNNYVACERFETAAKNIDAVLRVDEALFTHIATIKNSNQHIRLLCERIISDKNKLVYDLTQTKKVVLMKHTECQNPQPNPEETEEGVQPLQPSVQEKPLTPQQRAASIPAIKIPAIHGNVKPKNIFLRQ